MLLFLIGTAGVGKTYVGKLIREHYGFYFYDADDDLTEAMIEAIEARGVIEPEIRKEYFEVMINRIYELQQQFDDIVISQTVSKEENRWQILHALPELNFIQIVADSELIDHRIIQRNDWIDLDYARVIRSNYEVPQIEHTVLDNNGDEENLLRQLDNIVYEVA